MVQKLVIEVEVYVVGALGQKILDTCLVILFGFLTKIFSISI